MPNPERKGFLERTRFHEIFSALTALGYECVGPRIREGVILYDRISGPDDLPAGVRDIQSPGRYRLEPGAEGRFFAWANGPQALKPIVFSPRESLWESRVGEDGTIAFSTPKPDARPIAVFGVRSCDLAALALQEQHFGKDPFPDPSFRARRQSLFLIAVHCTHPADTCFCASTGDGPEARTGYDLALGELDHGFVVESGSEKGDDLFSKLGLSPVTDEMTDVLAEQTKAAVTSQTRALPGGSLRDPLVSRLGHPHWKTIADRCLSCGNCTSVCPTCFCFAEKEEPSLDGKTSVHYRQWDSCFTDGHSYIHPAPVRSQTQFRYRQWLTHKLGYWHDQYGRSGCVGCGRCIAWCPTGIDFTAEIPILLEGLTDGR